MRIPVIILPVVFLVGMALPPVMSATYRFTQRELDFVPGKAVSTDQMQRIVAAVNVYAQQHGRRPQSVGELVAERLLDPADIYDPARGRVAGPAGSQPAPSDVQPALPPGGDLLYLPAVDPADGADLVLACTIFLQHRGDRFVVALNDGRVTQMDSTELTAALQRTYARLADRRTNR